MIGCTRLVMAAGARILSINSRDIAISSCQLNHELRNRGERLGFLEYGRRSHPATSSDDLICSVASQDDDRNMRACLTNELQKLNTLCPGEVRHPHVSDDHGVFAHDE